MFKSKSTIKYIIKNKKAILEIKKPKLDSVPSILSPGTVSKVEMSFIDTKIKTKINITHFVFIDCILS